MRNFTVWRKTFALCAAMCLAVLWTSAAEAGDAVLEELRAVRGELEALRLETKALQEEIAGLREEFGNFMLIIGLSEDFDGQGWDDDPDSVEAAEIVADLRHLKIAALMFYADTVTENPQDIEALINTDGSAGEILSRYANTPEMFGPEHRFIVRKIDRQKRWFVGYDLSEKPGAVKELLQDRAFEFDLVNEDEEPYDGEDRVYMVVR